MRQFWIINFALFQLSWFCAAFYTAEAAYWITAILIMHFCFSPQKLADVKVLALLIPAVAIDSLHIALGTFSTHSGGFPLWLGLLWAMLLISLNHSLHWLVSQSLWLISLLGAISGTASYLAGIKAGAMQTTWSYPVLIMLLSLSWAVLLPLLAMIYRKLNPLAIHIKKGI
ncbi:DUF2878 domain-containing protein [Vibrio sp. S17_S38]|uniref:DUF2878 domain-containing protein n=1 Tax=Vibrio sp. S17_S38 TaxID=2720229 RepID=UPI0016818151|nr:DUF2878 domain-containing protein [Vibrio sp. S17_S38]MBD1573145.1 DUF2878 domain-containing protein [Vibrio sp. S17_S38]